MASESCGSTSSAAQERFAFIFPMASGHVNPSLPLARALVESGRKVHYLCAEQMRAAIEGTGAVFHNELEVEPELYEGRGPGIMAALQQLKKEYGLVGEPMMLAMCKLAYLVVEQQLPGVLRWLRKLQPRAVVYCPLINREAALAAKVVGVPSVALLTTAGPGSSAKFFREIMELEGVTVEQLELAVQTFPPQLEAVERLRQDYAIEVDLGSIYKPLGRLDILKHGHVTLVTTSKELQDPLDPELAAFYREAGVRFEFVGPLLDKEGAKRAAGHKYATATVSSVTPAAEGTGVDGTSAQGTGTHESATVDASPAGAGAGHLSTPADAIECVVDMVRAARAAGRRVVLASMGTVITGDSPDWGWEGRPVGADGHRHGLTGRELCQAAWGAVFDAFGSEEAGAGPLLVVSLGPQPDALGPLRPPANAVCLAMVPQVDVLKAGVDVFLTHGGQNSFMEALAAGVPVVVCPGFGDQPVNARKAEAIGAGLRVDRPVPPEGQEQAAAEAYRRDVATALCRVAGEPAFCAAAQRHAEGLLAAGGVPRALGLLLEAAAARGKQATEAPGQEQPGLRQMALLAGA